MKSSPFGGQSRFQEPAIYAPVTGESEHVLVKDGAVSKEWAVRLRSEVSARGEAKACAFVVARIREVNRPLWERLQQLASETTFSVRCYGRGQFYVWSHHRLLGLNDPWPAARFPRAAVYWDHLMALFSRVEAAA